MAKDYGFVVPEVMERFVDDAYVEDVQELAHTPLDVFVADMPEASLFGRYSNVHSAIRAIVMCPEEYDSTHAVFVMNPFGNGNTPSMYIRHKTMQKAIGDNKQVVVFPNNTTSEEFYWPNHRDLAEIRDGDASPLAKSIHAVAEELDVETIDIVGYSQGAFVTGALMKVAAKRGVVKVEHALVAEPTGVVMRTEKQLRQDFMKTGLLPLVRAVGHSGIPALTEAQAMRSRDMIKLARSMLGVAKVSKLPVNAALHAGMTRPNLHNDLCDGMLGNFDEPLLTMMRAQNSRITPDSIEYRMDANMLARQTFEIPGYGHEAADNVTGVFAPLVKAALTDPS